MVSAWIKTRLNFSLIRSMLLCVRGTQSVYELVYHEPDIGLTVHERKIMS